MSIIYNTFEENCETAFMQILNSYLKVNYKDYGILNIVNTSGDIDIYQSIEETEPLETVNSLILNLPRIICSSKSSVEEIYQSGIYRVSIQFIIKCNLDGNGDYTQAKALYSSVLDALQQVNLIEQLNNTYDNDNNSLVTIKGLILEERRLNEVEERRFVKIIDMDVIGFSPNADGSDNQQ